MVEHRVDVGDEVALRREAGQGCQFDDSQRAVCGRILVGCRVCVVFRGIVGFFGLGAGVPEPFVIDFGDGAGLLGPIADGGRAQQGGGAVDGHGVRTAHAMTARITEGQRRVDGAFDGQQAVEHGVRGARGNRVFLHPLLAARTTACRRIRAAAEWGAFLGERAAAACTFGALGSRRETMHLQGNRRVARLSHVLPP